LDAHNSDVVKQIYEVQALAASPTPQYYVLLKPFLALAPADTIKCTLSVTTQYARGRVSEKLHQHWKYRYPMCNVQRCNKVVATDTVFSDTTEFSLAVSKQLKSSLGVSRLLLMYMILKQTKSLSTRLKTTSANGEQWISSTVTVHVRKLVPALRIFSAL
jgi:hypothetical protein